MQEHVNDRLRQDERFVSLRFCCRYSRSRRVEVAERHQRFAQRDFGRYGGFVLVDRSPLTVGRIDIYLCESSSHVIAPPVVLCQAFRLCAVVGRAILLHAECHTLARTSLYFIVDSRIVITVFHYGNGRPRTESTHNAAVRTQFEGIDCIVNRNRVGREARLKQNVIFVSRPKICPLKLIANDKVAITRTRGFLKALRIHAMQCLGIVVGRQ